MIAIEVFGARVGADGRTYIRANMQCDTMPEDMPHVYDDVDGMHDGDAIDVGSRIYVLDTSAEYVLGEDWTWYQWATSGGGGGGGIGEEVDPKSVHDIKSVAGFGANMSPTSETVKQSDGTNLSIALTACASNASISFVDANGNTVTRRGSGWGTFGGPFMVGTKHSDVDECSYLIIRTTSGSGIRVHTIKIPDPIPGPQGEPGPAPAISFQPIPETEGSTGGYVMSVMVGEETQEISIANGRDGRDGLDGKSPTIMHTPIAGGNRITIVDAEGSEEFDVLDGESPTAMAERLPATDELPGRVHITVTDAQGTTEADLYDGADGQDGKAPTVSVERVANDDARINIPAGAKITVTLPDGTVASETYVYDGITPTIRMSGTADVGGGTIEIPVERSGTDIRPTFKLDFSAMSAALAAAGGSGAGVEVIAMTDAIPDEYTDASVIIFTYARVYSGYSENTELYGFVTFYWGDEQIKLINDEVNAFIAVSSTSPYHALMTTDLPVVALSHKNVAGKRPSSFSGVFGQGHIYSHTMVIMQAGLPTIIASRGM